MARPLIDDERWAAVEPPAAHITGTNRHDSTRSCSWYRRPTALLGNYAHDSEPH